MLNDSDIYVDPEEDEVFFGCISEKEKSVCAKLSINSESNAEEECVLIKDTNEFKVDAKNNDLENEESSETVQKLFTHETIDPAISYKLSESLEKNQDSIKILSNNVSVQSEHNYSTPLKHKIDKSILATPKSVVKADKDGGFLKVLSEIALVKAEAEGDKCLEDKKEDEDKENKIAKPIPEIMITEATPEKGSVTSPPRNPKTELRRFRIIYNSPQNEENIDHKSKSQVENFESEKNHKNKRLDQKTETNRKSIDLIDLNESEVVVLDEEEEEEKDQPFESPTAGSDRDEEKNNSRVEVVFSETKNSDCEVMTIIDSTNQEDLKKATENPSEPVKELRFSKEAKKIVEVLKKSTVDDTLNFTLPVIDAENEENSFLSPEPVSGLYDTVIHNEIATPKQTQKKSEVKSKTVEKKLTNLTPAPSESRLQRMKYFSERRFNTANVGSANKCVRKLPLEDKRPATVEKVKGGTGVPSTRIPVFGAKNSKVPLARPFTSKATPTKTPTFVKSHRNPKFNHIESPINAYIHNKPTSLVFNVKPELKKNLPSKVWKPQTSVSADRLQEKAPTSKAVQLPFVEYKSATPFKIEKRTESRLPRLAPTVLKLIGSNSPKVLRHEGRYFVNSPRKEASMENQTIVAEPNEVSVVVSQPALKSHTIK